MQEHILKKQILFTKDVEQIVGLNRTTLRRWWLEGKFPKPVKIHDSLLSWHYSSIEKWIEQNMAPQLS